jgi:hypothetical protein
MIAHFSNNMRFSGIEIPAFSCVIMTIAITLIVDSLINYFTSIKGEVFKLLSDAHLVGGSSKWADTFTDR